MTQEDKELLLKDICARLPYGIILDVDTIDWKVPQGHIKVKIEGVGVIFEDMSLIVNGSYYGDKYKPYLRPMSSMTEEEVDEFTRFEVYDDGKYIIPNYKAIDWLNAHHFDYRGLIERGLAIEVTENNNPHEN